LEAPLHYDTHHYWKEFQNFPFAVSADYAISSLTLCWCFCQITPFSEVPKIGPSLFYFIQTIFRTYLSSQSIQRLYCPFPSWAIYFFTCSLNPQYPPALLLIVRNLFEAIRFYYKKWYQTWIEDIVGRIFSKRKFLSHLLVLFLWQDIFCKYNFRISCTKVYDCLTVRSTRCRDCFLLIIILIFWPCSWVSSAILQAWVWHFTFHRII